MEDNYVNNLCKIMNDIGIEYDFQMSKFKYQSARSQIKHLIQNGGHLIKQDEYPKFNDYCRQVFEQYLKGGN
jgi:hypothetical protein